MIEDEPALVLLSGGLDSAVVLHMILEKKLPVYAICFDYGQEASKEIEYAKKMCEKNHVPIEVLDISNLELAGNLGEGSDKELGSLCVVPNRNAMFLSIATSYAIQYGIKYIYYGATGYRHPSFFDTTPDFVVQFNRFNQISDINLVQLRAPLIYTEDYDVLDLAMEYGIDLTETWSCFKNTDKPCGICDRCVSKQSLLSEYVKNIHKKESLVSKQLASFEKKTPELEKLLESYNPENEE